VEVENTSLYTHELGTHERDIIVQGEKPDDIGLNSDVTTWSRWIQAMRVLRSDGNPSSSGIQGWNRRIFFARNLV